MWWSAAGGRSEGSSGVEVLRRGGRWLCAGAVCSVWSLCPATARSCLHACRRACIGITHHATEAHQAAGGHVVCCVTRQHRHLRAFFVGGFEGGAVDLVAAELSMLLLVSHSLAPLHHCQLKSDDEHNCCSSRAQGQITCCVAAAELNWVSKWRATASNTSLCLRASPGCCCCTRKRCATVTGRCSSSMMV